MPVPFKEKNLIELDKAQSHYLIHVLRLSIKSEILIFNGEAGEWLATIETIRKNVCIVQCIRQVRTQTTAQNLYYLFAPLKHARLDYMVQKAVEMGVSSLQPVLTAHTQSARLNMERMKANAIEAAEQCGILSVPNINAPLKLEVMLQDWDHTRVLIFCDEREPHFSPLAALRAIKNDKLAVLIGPEGGFSDAERRRLLSCPFVTPISLGPRIMRADTAAVAALSIVNAVLGDWR